MYSMEMEAERRQEVLAQARRHERPHPAATEPAKRGWRAGSRNPAATTSARPSDETATVTSGLRG